MTVRRVTTGTDADGRSVVVEDTAVEPITTPLVPGMEAHQVWAADGPTTVPAPTLSQTLTYYPPVDGVRFQVLTVPPDGAAMPEDLDVAAALADLERAAPGIMGPIDPDGSGMHTTDSVDHIYVAAGSVLLVLDDGHEVELHAGDTVVQQGTRHAWRNPGDRPAVIVGVLVGARRG